MLSAKFFTNILRENNTYKYMIFCLLLGIVLILSIENIVVANREPPCVKDLKYALEELTHNECATVSKASREGFFVVVVGTGCEMIYIPSKVKADEVSEYVKSCLEDYDFVTVSRAEDDGYFHVYDPGNPGTGGFYGGMYGGMYGYGYGMNPMWGLGGLFGLYGSMPGITNSLYSGIGGYGNLSNLGNNSAHNFLSPFSIGYPISIGYPDFMLSNFLTTLLLGNIPLNNRPTAIPLESNPVRDQGLYRRAHGLINPVFPGSTLTPGFSLLNFGTGYPMSLFQSMQL